jgi:hypothetical protein
MKMLNLGILNLRLALRDEENNSVIAVSNVDSSQRSSATHIKRYAGVWKHNNISQRKNR